MECNKEEALRARAIAEKKMQIKDFAGALKIVQKAQNLFPELEHLSQMLTVCEVHCSADVKLGGELDWYGVLQVQPTVDDSSIKKQFRKLALLLHPDKNKFAGAEAAFKLIGEANVVLSDKAKRHLYDMKRKASPRVDPSRQPAPQMRKNTYASDSFHAVNLNGVNNQQKQPSAFANNQTFWTICPVCSIRYQYYKNIMNKTIRCQNCLKTFIAYDISAKVAPTGGHPNQSWNTFNPPVHQQANNINQPSQSGNASFTEGPKGSVNGAPYSHFDYGGGQPNVERNKVDHNGGAKRGAKPPTANINQKRSRKLAIESSDSDTSGDSEDEATQVNGPQTQYVSSSSAPTRRSTRHKQNINYSEVGSNADADADADADDYSDSPSSGSSDDVVLGSNVSGSTEGNFKNNRKDESFKEQANGSKQANIDIRGKSVCERVASNSSSTMAAPEQDAFSYPDPEFFDFDKLRHISQFAVDQIWALYDNVDGMPRFYARIRQVCSTRFKIQFTWLECNPLNDVVDAWCDEELPIACGNYILDSPESTEDQLMFSHVMAWEKGKKRNSYNIYPRKGEVWALFKNWNIQWNLDADNHRLYEYEVVEVLSDFAEVTGIQVTPLVKINGFVSLFMRSEEKVMSSHVIPPDEILRFSHNVPSYRLTGIEREGIPQGCLELDPASLPINFSESFPSINLCNVTSRTEIFNEPSGSGIKASVEKPGTSGLQGPKNSTSQNLSQNNVKGKADWWHAKNDGKPPKIDTIEKDELDSGHISSENENLAPISSSNPLTFEYPDAEFHNFDDARTLGNVRRGQIWALFSEIDGHPNYYGLVKKVDLNHKVHVAWLEPCPVSTQQKRWLSEGMPISCGTFKVDHYHIVKFDNIGTFSHLVQAKPNAKKGRHDILPSHGEIWAIYKNWDAGWSQSDWENCEYDVVVICQCTDAAIKVKTLTKVDGYRAVFKQDVETTAGSMDIPACDYVRFSHRIPSFRLTNERGGKLQGCWELDTASVPEILLI
ncbi:uncharacterized protein LOC122009945 [Zingiber officinale]|uniref:J domain-containing protein n=1 Tax=Zingiber officinale TaxID=94328 RepID=A0A8J5FXT0_ZINOF|nr:uncharacterized protein LOC122009945 [Zingiber officinale]XP_042422197.1 uncharacterized protein LOC122009945 [Zingiber officinale]XP_042422198.1 uncharacterized protein LOC122009945 [Zingiber officinale]XP_042422199.1 uncharacterized protein LOC122009945 [Zingiber officinale]XP_042422200.1 uncharacterized protein LOC122009945 [Zingiber officinale]XP_042422202.1 uncharacterized protein LOC122009945 [Zingiber officinale]KAG6487646.1 hypothetical protein ZIOFF_056237 [Zingiber officinale]